VIDTQRGRVRSKNSATEGLSATERSPCEWLRRFLKGGWQANLYGEKTAVAAHLETAMRALKSSPCDGHSYSAMQSAALFIFCALELYFADVSRLRRSHRQHYFIIGSEDFYVQLRSGARALQNEFDEAAQCMF
jgi:hypothetical protein